jgi:hypothetical protein
LLGAGIRLGSANLRSATTCVDSDGVFATCDLVDRVSLFDGRFIYVGSPQRVAAFGR